MADVLVTFDTLTSDGGPGDSAIGAHNLYTDYIHYLLIVDNKQHSSLYQSGF